MTDIEAFENARTARLAKANALQKALLEGQQTPEALRQIAQDAIHELFSAQDALDDLHLEYNKLVDRQINETLGLPTRF